MDPYNITANSISDLTSALEAAGATEAVIKELPKNANDKNQVYIAGDLSVLHPRFSLKFNERSASTSITKRHSEPGKAIPEAVFHDARWLKNDGQLVKIKNLKVIIYAQYPEARLSGFQAVDGSMPHCMSVDYTKSAANPSRLLALGATATGGVICAIVDQPSENLLQEVRTLEGFSSSRVCRLLKISTNATSFVRAALATAVATTHDGCRLNKDGNVIPFNGTQVCGYTLEKACGIRPNSDKDGDLKGIELKAHTQPKVTLFTPEPDFGFYKEDFKAFMLKYGYEKNQAMRLTGIYRANHRHAKSGLTLKIRYRRFNESTGEWAWASYQPELNFTSIISSLEVVLEDDEEYVTAGWSFERLMNSWDIKHSEVVYVPAKKTAQPDKTKMAEGFKHRVQFDSNVLWCSGTSAKHLYDAIHHGHVYLDPAPKLHLIDPKKNKRRCQWRLNNIHKTAPLLYDTLELVDLKAS